MDGVVSRWRGVVVAMAGMPGEELKIGPAGEERLSVVLLMLWSLLFVGKRGVGGRRGVVSVVVVVALVRRTRRSLHGLGIVSASS